MLIKEVTLSKMGLCPTDRSVNGLASLGTNLAIADKILSIQSPQPTSSWLEIYLLHVSGHVYKDIV